MSVAFGRTHESAENGVSYYMKLAFAVALFLYRINMRSIQHYLNLNIEHTKPYS